MYKLLQNSSKMNRIETGNQSGNANSKRNVNKYKNVQYILVMHVCKSKEILVHKTCYNKYEIQLRQQTKEENSKQKFYERQNKFISMSDELKFVSQTQIILFVTCQRKRHDEQL